MRRFVEGIDREQATLFPECLEDWIDKDNSVRAIDAFVDRLDLPGWGSTELLPKHRADLRVLRRFAEAPFTAISIGFSRVDGSSVTCLLCSTGITPLHNYYEAVRPSPAHRYFGPRGWSRLRLFP